MRRRRRVGAPDGKDVNYTYNYAWHTLNELYSELVPYTEHQQHSALVTAVVAYGVANLEKPLTRVGQPARNFRTDDEPFNKLVAAAKNK